MTKLLTLKHWQLFGLLFVVPMIFQSVIMGSDITNINPIEMLGGSLIAMILSFGLFFRWVYALGTNLHKKLPDTATMNLTFFKIFFFIPFVYMLYIPVFLIVRLIDISYSALVYGAKAPSFASKDFLFLFSLISFSCLIYCIYFNAKALKTVEKQKAVTFSDFAIEFFLICFFLIGLWIIQPRINKLFVTTIESDNNQNT